MRKILLIDDSIFTIHHYTGLLEELGFQVLGAEGGEEAIQLYQKESPDLVFCDLMMPEMDGFEVLEALNQVGRKGLFFLVTADIQKNTRDKAIQLGATDVIPKPLTPEILQEVLSRYGIQ